MTRLAASGRDPGEADRPEPGAAYLWERSWYLLTKPARRFYRKIIRAHPGWDPPGPEDAILDKCRREILARSPHHRYVQYSRTERYTWEAVSRWLYERRSANPGRVLDIGSAYGTLALYCQELFGCATFCLDRIPDYMSRELVRSRDLQFAVSDIERDPIPWPGPFDVIIFTEVLEHLNGYPVPTLKKIGAALAPAGFLYLTTPDPVQWGRQTKYYRSLKDMPPPGGGSPHISDHVYHYTRAELDLLFEDAGLAVRRFDYSRGASVRHLSFELVGRP